MINKFKKLDFPLLISTVLLFSFGALMILSASNVESFVRYETSPYIYFIKQLAFLSAGFFLTIFILNFKSKLWRIFASPYFYGTLTALFLLFTYGSLTNNANSWFKIGFISIQPSEFAKLAIILHAGSYYHRFKDKLDDQWVVIFPLIMYGLTAGMVLIQPDLGTATIMVMIVAAMFFALPLKKEIRKNYFKAIGGVAVIMMLTGFLAGSSFLTEEQAERLTFTDPCARYTDDGYQVCNSYIAINNGGMFGLGLGNSTQKHLYLPEAHTDFIFAIIVEEIGYLGSLIIFALFIIVIWRILYISKQSRSLQNAMVAYLIAIYILIHIFINLGGIFGLIPMTGVPLPFLSYGGSFTLNLMFALAIVQRISIENKTLEIKRNNMINKK